MNHQKLLNKAINLHLSGNHKEAAKIYKKIITLDPSNIMALNNFGSLLNTVGDFNGAKLLLKKALSIKPNYFDALNNLGISSKLSKDYLEAIEIFKKSDLAAIKIKKFFFERLGVSIANVCNILDPDAVVIGGGLSNQQTIYSLGKREVAKNIFSDSFNTSIRQNILGDSAGVIGAALLPVSSSF